MSTLYSFQIPSPMTVWVFSTAVIPFTVSKYHLVVNPLSSQMSLAMSTSATSPNSVPLFVSLLILTQKLKTVRSIRIRLMLLRSCHCQCRPPCCVFSHLRGDMLDKAGLSGEIDWFYRQDQWKQSFCASVLYKVQKYKKQKGQDFFQFWQRLNIFCHYRFMESIFLNKDSQTQSTTPEYSNLAPEMFVLCKK